MKEVESTEARPCSPTRGLKDRQNRIWKTIRPEGSTSICLADRSFICHRGNRIWPRGGRCYSSTLSLTSSGSQDRSSSDPSNSDPSFYRICSGCCCTFLFSFVFFTSHLLVYISTRGDSVPF